MAVEKTRSESVTRCCSKPRCDRAYSNNEVQRENPERVRYTAL